ncbi:hypothetical protein T492DRAFT_1114163, partial [Pavlovales sp. CCMP2436]
MQAEGLTADLRRRVQLDHHPGVPVDVVEGREQVGEADGSGPVVGGGLPFEQRARTRTRRARCVYRDCLAALERAEHAVAAVRMRMEGASRACAEALEWDAERRSRCWRRAVVLDRDRGRVHIDHDVLRARGERVLDDPVEEPRQGRAGWHRCQHLDPGLSAHLGTRRIKINNRPRTCALCAARPACPFSRGRLL